MDEATSALDNENEYEANLAIKRLNIARVVIGHRETTIKYADKIISL